MTAAILTIVILLGLIDSEVITLLVITPIIMGVVASFLIKVGEKGAFK